MKKRKTIENYLLQREIGRGNFGVVYYAIKLDWKSGEPKEYAVKKISKKVHMDRVLPKQLFRTNHFWIYK